MQTFLVILADTEGNPDYFHPTELNGNSKQEIKKLLLENTDADHIINIFTVNEYQNFINSKQFKRVNFMNNQSDNEDGNLFLNNMIEQATNFAESVEQKNNQQPTVIEQPIKVVQLPPNNQQSQVLTNILEFEDNGVKYKVEGNHMYKKVWKTVVINNDEQPVDQTVIDGKKEFRIINNKTNKEIDYSKYSLQKLDWQLVK